MKTPIRVKENFIMRPFTSADGEALHMILNDMEVIRYFPFKNPPTLEQTQRFVQRHIQHWVDFGYGWWALEDPATGRFLGWSGLEFLPELKQTEVGYLLARDFWGKGIATSSSREVLSFAFNETKLTTVIALVHPGNAASIRVLEKLGLHILEQINIWDTDMLKYSIDKSDFMAAD